MRYVITSTQLNSFRKEGYLTLEDFLTEQEVSHIFQLLEEAKSRFPSGRDLERENPPLRKAIPFARLGQVAPQIFGKKQIRCGWTQYPPHFPEEGSIEEVSSVTELLGGAMLHLAPPSLGNVTFYDKQFLLALPELTTPLLLIALTREKTRYRLNEKDPHTHALKKLGYGFGDALSHETHPLIAK
jgi:hypothetical protein